MNWKNKKVLVTGSGGFIGSHLAEQLVGLGADTRAFVHYNSLGRWGWLDYSDLAREMEIHSGDITDRDSVNQAMKGMDIVFHMAALIGIPYSYHAPLSYVRTNVEGSLNVFQSALENNVELVLHTSTSEVYGTAQYVPIDEHHPLQGQSPYSATKIGADKIAESFHRSFDLPVITLRPFNTYGPRQSSRAVIPTIITQCLEGDVIHLGNISPTRDLNYVADTVAGYIAAGSKKDAAGSVINLGTGKEISIGDLAQKIADLMGKKITIKSEENRLRPEDSEVNRLCAANERAKEIIGWEPIHSLSDGLSITIDWIKNHTKMYRPDSYSI